MNPIQRYITETVESNTKKLMVGDEAISPKVAVVIAKQAANMAGAASAHMTSQSKRLELACHMAGNILSAAMQQGKNLIGAEPLCREALMVVDTMFALVASNPGSLAQRADATDEEEAEDQGQAEAQTQN